MVSLPDFIYYMRTELKVVLGVALLIVVLPFIEGIVTAHSSLPGTTAILASAQPRQRLVHATPITTLPKMPLRPLNTAITWPAKGIVTLEFGASDLPYEARHTGIDIAGPYGQPITAFKSGTVIETGHGATGYGSYVKIDHGGNVTSIYGHLSSITVAVGDKVQAGDQIGREGQTGWATGPHVHFEIRSYGKPVNPRSFVQGNPSRS